MGNLRVQIEKIISNRTLILFNIYVNADTRSQSAARVEERKGGSFVVVLCCLFWCQSFGDVSPYVCSNYF